MSTDRADEIAREMVLDYIPDDRAALQEALVAEIAAALRSYGDEKLEEAVRLADAQGWTAPDLHTAIRFLKTSPSTQGTRTRIIIPGYHVDIDVTPKP